MHPQFLRREQTTAEEGRYIQANIQCRDREAAYTPQRDGNYKKETNGDNASPLAVDEIRAAEIGRCEKSHGNVDEWCLRLFRDVVSLLPGKSVYYVNT